jgi:glycosyltransferase involved in cell wall biosynthesis
MCEQSYPDTKIVIADASRDGLSEEMAERIHAKDGRVSIIRSSGQLSPWNALRFALKRIDSDYVMIADPNVLFDRCAVEVLYNTIKDSGADVVQMQLLVSSRLRKYKEAHSANSAEYNVLSGEKFIKAASFIGDDTVITPIVTDKLYKRDILKEALMIDFPGWWGYDHILNIHYMRYSRSLAISSYVGARCHKDDEGGTYYKFTQLSDAKKVYRLKYLLSGNPIMAQSELRDRLYEHVYHLIFEWGWTREAVIYSLNKELTDSIWQEIKLTESAGDIVSEVYRRNKNLSWLNVVRKLFR